MKLLCSVRFVNVLRGRTWRCKGRKRTIIIASSNLNWTGLCSRINVESNHVNIFNIKLFKTLEIFCEVLQRICKQGKVDFKQLYQHARCIHTGNGNVVLTIVICCKHKKWPMNKGQANFYLTLLLWWIQTRCCYCNSFYCCCIG